ncbi:MAG: UUP1 family membrane protein [Gammaproteobacteria bacterium]|nr:UUP1 family membrane protein [Gammaproteobacteria bacterium]
MKTRSQFYVLVGILLFIGISLTLYKKLALDFTLTPGGTETVWQIQARIQFDAEGGPAKISLTLPQVDKSRKVVFSENLAQDYKYKIIEEDKGRKAVWSREDVQGIQTIYLRADFYQPGSAEASMPKPQGNPEEKLDGPLKLAAEKILLKARESAATDLDIVIKVLGQMNAESTSSNVLTLLEGLKYRSERMKQVGNVLALNGMHSKVVRGLRLQGKYTQRSISTFIQVYAGDKWLLLDPDALTEIPFKEVVLWPDDTGGLLDVYGGKESRIDLSVTSTRKSGGQLAVEAGRKSSSALIDFSIYSLPIQEQNTFKLLLLIPLGALVVVILRNLVGIRTSGTFMPILIALTFMQTTLLLGLLLFLVVVGVGLIMRSYLSHLNLLLVPRIAAVLVFVIIIFGAIGIASHKLGWEGGLAITFFPMIILSWTIERMSILWEEEGPREVFVQGSGSLLTASLAYLLMINSHVEHLAFNFPELLLVLLAIIIMIGSYSGFRLVELNRFEPMTRE